MQLAGINHLLKLVKQQRFFYLMWSISSVHFMKWMFIKKGCQHIFKYHWWGNVANTDLAFKSALFFFVLILFGSGETFTI